jgi:hypothetical protein
MSTQLDGVEFLYDKDIEYEIWYHKITRLTNPYFLKSILGKSMNNELLIKITNSGLQAQELYEAQKHSSLLSRPILLLYAFERLALMLVLAKNPSRRSKQKHGVNYKGDRINVARSGLFSEFHDCFMSDPSIYQKPYSFRLQSLLENLPFKENDLNGILLREGKECLLVKVKEETSKSEVVIHE